MNQTTRPATKGQLWALFCITKQDYRNTKISFDEASKMIANSKLAKTSTYDFKDYFLSDSTVEKLLDTLKKEFGIVSVVKNDTNFVKDDGKRYLFLGGGCGFSYIEFDKRNKLGEIILKEFKTLRKDFEKKLLSKLEKDYLQKLEKSGNPIQAHLFQNLSYNTSLNYIVANYMEEKGIKKVRVTSMLD